MKTKIIYISGNEIFDMADIRAAFEEVRVALNLDKNTVLFGVPVDADDAGIATKEPEQSFDEIAEPIIEQPEIIETPLIDEEIIEDIHEEIVKEPVIEEQPQKKRGRPRKETVINEENIETTTDSEPTESVEEKVIPILSVLSNQENEQIDESSSEQVDFISEISDEIPEQENPNVISEDSDLEKLLEEMTPLQEDVLETKVVNEPQEEDISVDATLEQLANEFAETQDKIATENKSSSRSKIGKLRNILPFKQSKHKDQGLGDLFGWAGIAANDEDFSVPGFFTNAASKK